MASSFEKSRCFILPRVSFCPGLPCPPPPPEGLFRVWCLFLYIYQTIYMLHAAVTLDYIGYSADWLRLNKRKSRKMIGTVEVKKKIWIGKIEAKKKWKSLIKCILSLLSTLHEVPVSKVPNREPQPQCVDVTVPGHTHMLFCQALPLFLGRQLQI